MALVEGKAKDFLGLAEKDRIKKVAELQKRREKGEISDRMCKKMIKEINSCSK